MLDVLISIRHHCAAPIPPLLADDVHRVRKEGVGVSHDRADVEIVLEVLDRDMKTVPSSVEICDDRLSRPVSVLIKDISAIALRKQNKTATRTTGSQNVPNDLS